MRQSLLNKGGRYFRFLIAGGIGISLYQALLIGLTEHGVWYVLSAAIAFFLYLCLSFRLQKYWVFRNKDKKYVKKQLIQFVFFATLGWVVNTYLLWTLVEDYHYWYLPVTLTLTTISAFLAIIIFTYIFRHRT